MRHARMVVLGIVTVAWVFAIVYSWTLDPSQNEIKHLGVTVVVSYLAAWGLVLFWTRMPRDQAIPRLLGVAVAAMLPVAACEVLVAAHIVDFRIVLGTPIDEPWRHPHNLLDGKLLHIHRPNERVTWGGVEYKYDRHGFRNARNIAQADVIVVGDSFIEGWPVTSDELLTTRLEAELQRPVANLGQAWYGPDQELEVVRRFGLPLRPRACIWAFFEGNDLHDVRRYRWATQNWPAFSRTLHTFSERSFTLNGARALVRLRRQMFGQDPPEPWGGVAVFTASDRRVNLKFLYPGYDLNEDDELSLQHTRGVIAEAAQLCASSQARFLLVFIPIKYRVYRDFVEFDVKDPARYWVLNDLPERLRQITVDASGEFIDLTPALVAQARLGRIVYEPRGTHWNGDGHKIAARAIAEWFTRSIASAEK